MSKLSSNVELLLQEQYKHEMSNHFRYKQRASWAEMFGFTGAAAFFNSQADGESSHAKKIFDFLIDRNVIVNIQNFTFNEPTLSDFISLFTTSLEIELITTEKLKTIAKQSLDELDLQTFYWLSDLIIEQTEEENLYQTIIDRIASRKAMSAGNKSVDDGCLNHDIDVWIAETFVK